jgi:phosphoglycolate phosphatase
MKIKAIIFDLDGTLFNSIEDIALANNMMLEQNNFPTHGLGSYVKWIGNGALQLVVKSLPKDIQSSDDDTLNNYLLQYSEFYAQNINVKSSLYSGIDRVLNYLTEENIPMSINTNKPHDLTMQVVKHYFELWDFKYIIGQKPGMEKKPNPQSALFIANELNIKPENILFIGDSDVDFKTGNNAGMQTMGVTWGYDEIDNSTGFDIVVDKTSEMIEFIRKNTI